MLNNQEIQAPVLIEDLGSHYPSEKSKDRKRFGLYTCHCGKEFKAQTSSIKSGNTKSCGCYSKQVVRTTHGMCDHNIYNTWSHLLQRTMNHKNKYYEYYGGRGITVCERWLKFENFRDDMYATYQEGLTIDRINNDGNYEPSNCRWTTRAVQSRNTRVIRSNNNSGYRGVYWHKRDKNWVAQIRIFGKPKYLGIFHEAIEAARAYDKYVIDNNLEHSINGV